MPSHVATAVVLTVVVPVLSYQASPPLVVQKTKYCTPANAVTGTVNVALNICAAVAPEVLTVTEPKVVGRPPTVPEQRRIVCDPLFPARVHRPNVFMTTFEAPTVKANPDSPPSSVRDVPNAVTPVTNSVVVATGFVASMSCCVAAMAQVKPIPEIIHAVLATFTAVAVPPAASVREPVVPVPDPANKVIVSEVMAMVTVLIWLMKVMTVPIT